MSNPCTKEGYKILKNRLRKLISNDRQAIIKDIAQARSHGDLKENAEYHAAKEKQGMIEAQIAQLSSTIADAQIIDTTQIKSEKIQFGATVEYEDLATKKIYKWYLVGKDEVDIENQKMSIFSPIAKGLVGKKEGDSVKIKTLKGILNLNILSVEYN